MTLQTPIKITLYDPETDEEKATYSRTFVPWRLLKAAIRLEKLLDPENLTEDISDALAELVVETFDSKFSVEDLDRGADIGEMVTVLTAIISRARGLTTNPFPPET